MFLIGLSNKADFVVVIIVDVVDIVVDDNSLRAYRYMFREDATWK